VARIPAVGLTGFNLTPQVPPDIEDLRRGAARVSSIIAEQSAFFTTARAAGLWNPSFSTQAGPSSCRCVGSGGTSRRAVSFTGCSRPSTPVRGGGPQRVSGHSGCNGGRGHRRSLAPCVPLGRSHPPGGARRGRRRPARPQSTGEALAFGPFTPFGTVGRQTGVAGFDVLVGGVGPAARRFRLHCATPSWALSW